MALSNAPGEWHWERRGSQGSEQPSPWYRVNDDLNIQLGPYNNEQRSEYMLGLIASSVAAARHKTIGFEELLDSIERVLSE
jgi:hypothetical protein